MCERNCNSFYKYLHTHTHTQMLWTMLEMPLHNWWSAHAAWGRKKTCRLQLFTVWQDPATGKIPPRQVNPDSAEVQAYVRNIMDYITPDDYEAAKKYLPNPEEYDFKIILNW